jgi:hypothetical protein
MRILLFFAFSLYFTAAHAAIVRWPGPAPCAGTLIDCMNSLQDGDVIELTSDAVINGVNFVFRAVSLKSATGFNAALTGDGLVIFQISSSAAWSLSLSDLSFRNVGVQIRLKGIAAGRLDISDNSFFDVNSNGQFQLLIYFDQSVNTRNVVSIRRNKFLVPATEGFSTAVYLSCQQPSSPLIEATNNTFSARPTTLTSNFRRALVAASSGSNVLSQWDIEFARNRVVGSNEASTSRLFAGFGLTAFAGSAMAAHVHDNVFLLDRDTSGGGTAILAGAQGGEINLRALNNTIKDADYAIGLGKNAGGILSAKIDNNIMLNGFRALDVETLVASDLAQRKNLVFSYPNPGTIPLAADTLLLDPMLGSATDLHLRPGSPAIDAGLDLARSELGPGALPAPVALDAERYQRIQSSHVDIGALEGTRLFNDGLE